MIIEAKKISCILWAAVGVPVLFSAYVQWTYKYSFNKGGLPFNTLPEWLWYVVFGALLISGVAAVFLLLYKKQWVKYVVATTYAAVMVFILLWAHLYVACINGDCL